LDKYGVELIGAKLPSINKAEDRELFKIAMQKIGLKTPQSGTATTMEEALAVSLSYYSPPPPPPSVSLCVAVHQQDGGP
jgi:carbamoylphosphate synthase large subunit